MSKKELVIFSNSNFSSDCNWTAKFLGLKKCHKYQTENKQLSESTCEPLKKKTSWKDD